MSQERSEKETKLFDSFSTELTEDDIKEVKEKSSEYSLEEIEEKLFTLVGKKKANFSASPKKEKKTVKIDIVHEEAKDAAYGGLFEKYSK